jgi:hypothetical protein
VRSFRHAATLTAAQLVSSWITVSAGLTKSRELAKFQLDAEEKKKSKVRVLFIASRASVGPPCFLSVNTLRVLVGLLLCLDSKSRWLFMPPSWNSSVAHSGLQGGAGMNPAAAALRRTLDRCHARVEDLKNFRSVTFTGVFSHRFRCVVQP